MELKSNNVINDQGGFFYEDSDLIIDYDFWKEPGIASFNIYNKTDSCIFIDWSKCHFVNNNQSFDYWIDLGASKAKKTKSNKSISKKEPSGRDSLDEDLSQNRRVYRILPKNYLKSDFDMNIVMYDSSDFPLALQPGGKVAEFDVDNNKSGYRYYNFITFSKDSMFGNPRTVCNKFWVTKIMNMKEEQFNGNVVRKVKHENNRESSYNNYAYPYLSPNRVYMVFQGNINNNVVNNNSGCTFVETLLVALLLALTRGY